MIAVVDYGMGNLRSVQKAFEYLGFDARITSQKQEMKDASHIVLPGVGAFGDAICCLEKTGVCETIGAEISKGKPFLGICLGMQLLFEKSLENGLHGGLGLVPGEVVPFPNTVLKVPHMGWNDLAARSNALFDADGQKFVYFVHSYYAANVSDEYIIAQADYGCRFVAAVQKDNVFGLQFHPEKSGDIGLDMLRRFGGLT